VEFADVRPISGVCANLVVYTAFTEPGDTMMALSIPSGGHISMGRKKIGGTAGSVRGLEVEYFPFDVEEMNIDVDATIKSIRELSERGRAPKLAMFGGSVLPFPHPVAELQGPLHDCGAIICYDAAHVAGLIAGGQLQDPIREGADVMTASTHKTIPGPQGGIVLSWERFSDRIKRAVFPGNVSNVAFAEMLEFGRAYAEQIVRNSRALGQALYERGFKVLGEKKGFTRSHVLIVDISEYGDGKSIEKDLERANIILNRNLLPYDIKMGRHFEAPGGIRLGTSECTRLGMRESEMAEIADLIARVVIKKEPPERVREDVIEFRKGFQRVHFAFESLREAYEYIRIR
jgi:glycine hydroxymethyltransferase